MGGKAATRSNGAATATALAGAAACLGLAAKLGLDKVREIAIPEHLLGHPAVFVPELFGRETQTELLNLLKAKGTIPSNSADLSFYTTKHEHIGEAQPMSESGTCSHPYLLPNMNRTLCVLPGRIDIARAYAMTGGYNSLKESLSKLFSRLQSFGVYLFDLEREDHRVIRELFNSKAFLGAARAVCPKSKQHLDPFQFNFIVQVPGQTVATHVDGVYFTGATRFQFPQWLLAVMHFSGLFQDSFVDQVQVVGYASDWDSAPVREAPSNFGEFVFWDRTDDLEGRRMAPLPRSGNAIDGSKSVHTTTLYRPDVLPPYLDKNKRNELVFRAADDSWDLMSSGERIRAYNTSDLRISIVYRARCFEDQAAADLFRRQLETGEGMLELDDVLSKVVREAEARTGSVAPSSRLDLALWLVNTFINYPLPPPSQTWFPFNVCALPLAGATPLC